MEEEEKEAKRAERKARDKEASYQERLRKWETREGKMAKEHVKYREKEAKRKLEQDREAKKLREFLEDYDDEKDDEKFYKNRELERRLFDREREAQKDADDREKEKAELDELRAQIEKEGYDDPNAELQRRLFIANAVQAPREEVIIPQLQSYDANDDDIAVIEPDNNGIADHGDIAAGA